MAMAVAVDARAAGGAQVDVPQRIALVADRDDDDGDGRPDCEGETVAPLARADVVPLGAWAQGAKLRALRGGEHARLLVDGRVVPWGTTVWGAAAVQGLSAGLATIAVSRGASEQPIELAITSVRLRDGALHEVDMARSHASIERTPPTRADGSPDAPYDDPDALRVLVASDVEHDVSVESVNAAGERLDALAHLRTDAIKCEDGLECRATAPLRFVVDDVDRVHPLVRARSIRVEIGGAVVVWIDGKKAQSTRVLGPRATPAGPVALLRATLRPFVMRLVAGGAPAVGGDDASAVQSVRAELAAASAIWSQCGVTFGEPPAQAVHIADPPPSHLIAVGDGLGLPATGGQIDLRVDGKPLFVPVTAGSTPDRVAIDVARALQAAGYLAIVSPNARIAPGSFGSVDVSVRRADGSLATVDVPPGGGPACTDATLTVRIGSVDLADGLQHFTDTDAMAGTIEERTLLKAVDDGDPSTIEVVIVPMFAGGGRIGESFIGSDLSSLRNVVLLDRAGIRARRSSLTLAHELGHVLLDMPGHPDDYGVDTPTLLMDSDASDASPFGPRRITLDECARMLRESGPASRVPLLSAAPVSPLVLKLPRPPLEE